MNPTQHKTNNKVFGAPKDWDQKELPCSAIAVTVHKDSQGTILSTFWRPTTEEIEQLKVGALVRIWVFGEGLPPMSVTVEASK